MKKLILTIGLIVLFSTGVLAETYTLNSFYPTPIGVYSKLRLYPNDDQPAICTIGQLYVSTLNELYFCSDVGGGIGNWFPMGSSYWSEENNNVFPENFANSSLYLGIGTSEPTEKMTLVSTDNTKLEFSEDTITGSISLTHQTSASAPNSSFDILREGEIRIRLTSDENIISSQDGSKGYVSFFNNYENASEAEVMTVRNGRVGIGTNNPSDTLHVMGNAEVGLENSTTELYFDDTNGRTYRMMNISDDKLYIQKNDFKNKDISGWRDRMTIQSNGNIGMNTTSPDYKLDVKGEINATDYLVNGSSIAAGTWKSKGNDIYYDSGNVGIGTSDPQYDLHVKGPVKFVSSDKEGFVIDRIDGNKGRPFLAKTSGTDYNMVFRGHDGAAFFVGSGGRWSNRTIFSVDENKDGNHQVCIGKYADCGGSDYDWKVVGSAAKNGGGPWSSASDRRLKKNITTIKGALDQMLSLRGVNFEWKDLNNALNLPGVQMGFIAQEAQEVFPGWVAEGDDGYLVLSIRGFEGLTVETFRELNKQFEEDMSSMEKDIEIAMKAVMEQQKRIEALKKK